jgi:hypothetical protein
MLREIITRDDKHAKSSIIIGPNFIAFQDKWHGCPWEAMAITEMEMLEESRGLPDWTEEELIRESEISLVMAEPSYIEPMCLFEIATTIFEKGYHATD